MVGVLVTFHEFGHFWVARKLGTRVERFSVGFGKPLYRWYGKDDTEYVIAAIPLGGYVKMLDSREQDLTDDLKSHAFDQKNVWARIAIVLAGPLFNFILAAFFYWLVFIIGLKAAIPVIGEVAPNSLAAKAGVKSGMEIVQVNDTPTPSWQAVVVSFIDQVGEDETLALQLKDPNSKKIYQTSIDVEQWPDNLHADNLFETLGIDIARPTVPAKIGSVIAAGPGDRAGLMDGDLITHLNGQTVHWNELVNFVTAHPNEELELTVVRNSKPILLSVIPEDRDNKGTERGWLGVGLDESVISNDWVRRIHYDPITAAGKAIDRTVYFSALTLEMIGKLVTGEVALDNLSGPVAMAQGAGQTAQSGIITYLSFLAIVSISLGIMNLLPIPLLDGGHLVFYLVEAIRGRALSDKSQELGLKLGAMALLALFSVALYNDISRLLL